MTALGHRGSEGDGPAMTVVRAVAAYTDSDPMDLPPLHATIDTDALDALFSDRGRRSPRSTGAIAFSYAGCDVTVHADGTVDVSPPAEG